MEYTVPKKWRANVKEKERFCLLALPYSVRLWAWALLLVLMGTLKPDTFLVSEWASCRFKCRSWWCLTTDTLPPPRNEGSALYCIFSLCSALGLHLLSRCILTCGVYPSSFYVVTHIAGDLFSMHNKRLMVTVEWHISSCLLLTCVLSSLVLPSH